MKPTQPLHFTRGYIWIPLFLLGAPTLLNLFRRAAGSHRRVLGGIIVAGLVVLFLMDNALWLATAKYSPSTPNQRLGLYLTTEDLSVLEVMNRAEYSRSLVVSSNSMLGYLATVYSPLRSWVSHIGNTPNYARRRAELKAFFWLGVAPQQWRNRSLLVISGHNLERSWRRVWIRQGMRLVLRNSRFAVYTKPASR
jgi:hypothetical protein